MSAINLTIFEFCIHRWGRITGGLSWPVPAGQASIAGCEAEKFTDYHQWPGPTRRGPSVKAAELAIHDLDRIRRSRFEGLGKRHDFGKIFIFVRGRDDYVFAESVLPDTSPIETLLPRLLVYADRTEKLNASCEEVT